MKRNFFLIIMVLFTLNSYAEDKFEEEVSKDRKSIIINLENQMLFALEDENVVMEFHISSGRYLFPTPSGIFPIIERQEHHISNLYPKNKDGTEGGAEMLYMLRLTWDGIAIHQGIIPKVGGKVYPNSHGCIRVPKKYAKKLFFWARKDVIVNIINQANYLNDRVNRMRIMMNDSEDLGDTDDKKRKKRKRKRYKRKNKNDIEKLNIGKEYKF